MPLAPDIWVSFAKAAATTLWDGPPLAQAIVNVRVIPLVTAVRIRFDTIYPAWATIEIYRMIHGEIDLDMEKENIVRTEIELFGDARTRHNMIVRGLEQERRFWFRISVPRKSPAEPAAGGNVRARGEFATLRRFVMVDIENIRIDNDSDDNSPGEIGFSSAIYDATMAGGPRLTPSRYRREDSLPDGRTVEAPFGTQESIAKAPDALGIWVLGFEDDASDFPYPGQGLNLIGMGAPDQMPTEIWAKSTGDYDRNEALGIVGTRQLEGRSTKPFSFSSVPGGRLAWTVNGRLFETVENTLGSRPIPPWKLITRMQTRVARDGRMATWLWTRDGRIELALSPEGRLLRRDDRRVGGWQALDSPAFGTLTIRLMSDGSYLLVGQAEAGGLQVARSRRLGRDLPRWHALAPMDGEIVQASEAPDGTAVILALDGRGTLWLVTVGEEPVREARPIAEETIGHSAIGFDRRGRLAVACSTNSGMMLIVLDPQGEIESHDGLGEERLVPLAIAEHERRGLVVAGLDPERRVLVRHAADADGRWDDAGPLDELLDGPFERVPVEPADPEPDPPT